MAAYVVRRVLWMIVVVLIVTFITYAIFYLLPSGDPAVRFAGKSPTPQTLALVRHNLGLDHAWYTQYGLFVKRLVVGDQFGWPGLGFSYDTHESVRGQLGEKATRTLWLIAGASVIWLIMGVLIGIVSALKRRTLIDRFAMGFALLGISTPVFWLGFASLWLFWQKTHLLPGTGYVPFTENTKDWFLHMIQPWIVLALLYAAFYARMVRGNLLDTMGEDYIRTARAKGLPERTVVFKHGLRSSLTPVVTMFGMDIALLVGGALITEKLFNLQGLGAWAVDSVFRSDFPATVAVVLIGAVAVTLMNLIVDIIYAYLDPRVRYS